MKKVSKIIMFIAVLLLAVCALVACDNEDETTQNGIIIVKSQKSIITADGMKAAIEELLNGAVKEKTGRDLNTAKNRIAAIATKAERTVRDNNVGNEVYVAILEELKTDKEEKITALSSLFDGTVTPELRSLTLFLINQLGKDVFSEAVYNSFACYLETVYKEYKDGGYQTSSVDEAKQDWEDFLTIEKEDFTAMLSIVVLASDLSSIGEDTLQEESQKFSFNDGEIAAIARTIDISNNVQAEGWRVLIRLVGSLMSEDSFWGMVYKKAENNSASDDFLKAAEAICKVTPLAESVQKKITAEWVTKLKAEDKKDAYTTILKSFSEDDWEMLEDILGVTLSGIYLDVGTKFFGIESDFISYSSTIRTYTVEDLKNCINETDGHTADDISEVMEGIVANISPIFSYYGWRYDRG